MSSLSVELICIFCVENKSALSNEGKLLNRLLKTSSETGVEKMQQSKASCWCWCLSYRVFILLTSQLCWDI